jgi:predicted hexulose-6-phosphate isomerase
MHEPRRYKLGLYEKALPPSLCWEEKFKVARNSGYDYLEMSIDETDEKLERLHWSDRELYRLVDSSRFEGLAIGSLCLSGHRRYPLGGSDSTRSLCIMQEAIHFASAIGCPIIQLAGYDVYYEPSTEATRGLFATNLHKAVEMAATSGILLGFETMETPFMDTVGKAMEYVTKIDSPFLGVYPDIGNLNNSALLYQTDILSDLDVGKGHIFATHIKETIPKRYREVVFGTGVVDFPRVLKKVWELGVRRYVTELWYTGNENWEQRVREASMLSTGILDNVACQ